MNVFFDTSSLFKLYHKEAGTEELMTFIINQKVKDIFLAEITKIEFYSVVWKKCRNKEISEDLAIILISKFEKDCQKYKFVNNSKKLTSSASNLLKTHWKKGLRTLDSVQLASALKVKKEVLTISTSDKLLAEICKIEGMKVI